MANTRPTKLHPPVDPARDHILGDPDAELTLVEFGDYACPSCHAAHEVVADLRDRFGERMRYVFRHRPAGDSDIAQRAADLAEHAFKTTDEFWPVHHALMKRGPTLTQQDLDGISREFNLPPCDETSAAASGDSSSICWSAASHPALWIRSQATFSLSGRIVQRSRLLQRRNHWASPETPVLTLPLHVMQSRTEAAHAQRVGVEADRR